MNNVKQWNFPTTEEINRVKRADLVCVDIETYDPDLKTKGPSMYRGDGFICGNAFGCIPDDGVETSFYLPIGGHGIHGALAEKCRALSNDLLSTTTTKIGANIMYDVEWLRHENFKVADTQLHDVQFAEPLLNEYAWSYHLNDLAKKYLDESKKSNLLDDYGETQGWKKGDAIERMPDIPLDIAAEYACQDTILPIKIFKKQKLLLETQRLYDLYVMETELIPLLLAMRKQGVRLNLPMLHRTIILATDKRYQYSEKIYDWAGYEFNVGSSAQLAKVLDEKGISYPRNAPTEKMIKDGKPGSPNLDAEALNGIARDTPFVLNVLHWRHFNTMINLFLHTYIDLAVDGRIHGSFHPLRTDDYGTVSGRFSGSKPNLQQVSAKELVDDIADDFFNGKVIRKLFIPEEGNRWAKLDYSQVEYRILAHYASDEHGGEELRRLYNDDPDTDYHEVIQQRMNADRRTAKRFNFGSMYGMGVATTARKFGYTFDEAEALNRIYHNSAPYIKPTRKQVLDTAKRRGFIFTILGRKARVHPSRKLHALFNRLIQGSAADIMKKSMVDAWKSGVFNVLKPHMTVHDEIDVSYIDDHAGNEALAYLKNTMENTIKLDVPLKVDCHTGENWAEAD